MRSMAPRVLPASMLRWACGLAAGAWLLFVPAVGGERAVLAAPPQRLLASDLWLAPSLAVPALGTAVNSLSAGNALEALPVFARAASDPVLGGYARLYQGRAELALNRADAAMTSADRVLAGHPTGYLSE